MKKAITLEILKAERKALTEELRVLDQLITIHERRQKASGKGKQGEQEWSSTPRPISTRERVLTTVYNLVRKLGRAVSSQEIFEEVDSLHILDKVKNKQAMLAAILDQLTKKDKPQLNRVTRGVYDIIK